MDGIINVLKPPGMTSADVVAWVRHTLGMKRVGHTGTLDPAVAGVLPICCGKATRLAEYLTDQGKAYRAEITFGAITDTQDAYGTLLNVEISQITPGDLAQALEKFKGKIKQIPPIFSAVRKNGKHLYEYARAGKDIEREAREIEISRLELIEWQQGKYPRALLDIECSKGTYIRTLCHDIGEYLGCGAHMSYLLRVRSGPYNLDESWTLEEIKASVEDKDYEFLLPFSSGLHLPEIHLPKGRAEAFSHGLPTRAEQFIGIHFSEGTQVQVLTEGQLLGIGIWKEEGLYPHKVLV